MFAFLQPEPVDLVTFSGNLLTFQSRRKRRQGRQRVRLLLSIAGYTEKLDLPVVVRQVCPSGEGKSLCSGVVPLDEATLNTLQSLLGSLAQPLPGCSERRSPRQPCSLVVRSPQLAEGRGVALDLSPDGLKISAQDRLPLGVWVQLVLELEHPDFSSLTLGGRVVWCQPSKDRRAHRIGVELVHRNLAERRVLENYLAAAS